MPRTWHELMPHSHTRLIICNPKEQVIIYRVANHTDTFASFVMKKKSKSLQSKPPEKV
jgi:hypothetical protein